MLVKLGRLAASFCFGDELRPGVREAIVALEAMGVAVEILSGDHLEVVRTIASLLNVVCRAAIPPARIDAPARSRAQVSRAPASAATSPDLRLKRRSLRSKRDRHLLGEEAPSG